MFPSAFCNRTWWHPSPGGSLAPKPISHFLNRSLKRGLYIAKQKYASSSKTGRPRWPSATRPEAQIYENRTVRKWNILSSPNVLQIWTYSTLLSLAPSAEWDFIFGLQWKFTWMYHLTKYLYFHKLDTPQNMHYFQKKAITVLQKKKMTGYEADQSTMLFHVVIVWELELFPDLEFGGCLLPQCCPKWKDLSSLAPIIMVILFAAMSHRSSSCGRGGTLLGSSVAQRTAYSDNKAHPCLSWELRGLNFGLLFPLGRATWQITTYAT